MSLLNKQPLKPLRTALLLASLGLTACTTVGPDYQLPQQALVNDPTAASVLDADAAITDSQADLPQDWWKLYSDAQLDALVQEALHNNRDIRAAWHHLRAASEQYAMALHANEVEIGGSTFAGHGQISSEAIGVPEQIPIMDLAHIDNRIGYQLDLFGQLKRASEAASADAEATRSLLDSARIRVAAAVTGSYLGACHAADELRIAGESLAIQQRQLEVTRQMLSAGRGTAVDVARAEAQTASLRASLPPLQAQHQAALHALSALLGRVPGDLPAGVAACASAPQLAAALPTGDGTALLRRRPDVRGAERKLAAASARIGMAVAEMYPRIELGASFGYSGMLDHVGDGISNFWDWGPHISWHIPTEVDHARVRAREAGADAALAEFDAVVLQALRETRTLIDQVASDLQRREALEAARDAARRAADDSRRLYQQGRIAFLDSLDAERTLATAEAALAASETALARHQVELFLALGGGWQGKEAPLDDR